MVTADALQSNHAAAEFLVTRKHTAYLFTVKGNQPNLLDRCARLGLAPPAGLDRTLKAVSVGWVRVSACRAGPAPPHQASLARLADLLPGHR